MRVMYIHAGKRINKDLKADDYHVDLFRDKLKLRFEVPSHRNAIQNLLIDSQSSMEKIEKLPRGQILGVVIFSETYWFNKSLHMDDPYQLGPFCYGILDVCRFEKGVNACGQLGIWTPKHEAQKQIEQQISVQTKINQWKQAYGDKLYFGKDPDGIPSALTILQPFVEAILRGEKRVENRKRPFFKLHDNKLLYKHPIAPKPTQCRFCPDDGRQCVYWAHMKDGSASRKKKRIIRSHKKYNIYSDDSEEEEEYSSDRTETEEDYSSEENGTIEYNTRSTQRKFDSFLMNTLHIDTNNSVPNGKRRNRKRKRSETDTQTAMNSDISVDCPPSKKQKKKSKKRRKKKKKRMIEKWEACKTDLSVGEDGVEPERMCYHNHIMRPQPNPLSSPIDCDICGETISWDQYYKCECHEVTTNWCFRHTRELRFHAPSGWMNVGDMLKKYPVGISRKQVIQSLSAPTGLFKKKKHKTNKVGVGILVHKKRKIEKIINLDRARKPVPVANGNNNHNNNNYTMGLPVFDPKLINFKLDVTTTTTQTQQTQQTPPAVVTEPEILNNMYPFKKPFILNFDENSINMSINAVQHKTNAFNAHTHSHNMNNMNNGSNNNKNYKMDFSKFPTNIAPTISGPVPGTNHAAASNYNNGNISINKFSPTNVIQPQQPTMTTMLSLSQILNQNTNNTHKVVTPVPSPFAPSPSPTTNNNNNNTNTNSNNTNNMSSMSNVYALQSLLNSNNKNVNNENTNNGYKPATQPFIDNIIPNALVNNPFGPTSTNNNINNNNNNTNISQNSPENTSNTSSTSTLKNNNNNNTNGNNNNNNTVNAKNLSSYFGPVITPSYQTMQPQPMSLQYSVPIQNGFFMVPGAAQPNMATYYQNGVVPYVYPYPQYPQQPNKPNIAVPVQQT